jgi:hypothetical protein
MYQEVTEKRFPSRELMDNREFLKKLDIKNIIGLNSHRSGYL